MAHRQDRCHHHHRHHHRHVERHAHCEALQTLSNPNTAFLGGFLHFTSNIVLVPLYLAIRALYIFFQRLIIAGWKQAPPPERIKHPYGRIAVIGAGLTGISSAAHAISHGFEVVIFDADDRVGGIWAHENKTSELQVNSMHYRFHPAVLWRGAHPKRDEILWEIKKIWKEYRLEERTCFNSSARKRAKVRMFKMFSRLRYNLSLPAHGPSLWYINDGLDGPFDAIITAVGTCGEPRWVPFEGMPADAGKIDEMEMAGKCCQQEPCTSAPGGEGRVPPQMEKSCQRPHEATDLVTAPPVEVDDVTSPGSPPGTARKHPDTYRGPVLHSSQLDHATPELVHDKIVVIVGSGASAVEAVETAFCRGARRCIVLARKDKWIIPRNPIIVAMIAAQPSGRDMPLSFLWERFLQYWHYHGVAALVPTVPLFSGTPIVNDLFLDYIRSGKCAYVRGDTLRLTQNGVLVDVREWIQYGAMFGVSGERRTTNCSGHTDAPCNSIRESKPQTKQKKPQHQGASHVENICADLIVLATGYKRPDIDFLPCELFPEGYEASALLFIPNLYLQNFSTEDWSILMTNSAYDNAIASAGHFHIGIYTRILLTFILDPAMAPTAKDMKLWVDAICYLKRGASGGALGFFTHMELIIWLLLFYVVRPDRLRWMPFILAGWGVRPDNERLLRTLDPQGSCVSGQSDNHRV
ncbi:FAD/NAD(P)-binding domain-containing protein [Paxillus ammoniavirescens]|nr:FAD/NAD(P)-binding domain-containing protein [Paxillus ammoniavirescens]